MVYSKSFLKIERENKRGVRNDKNTSGMADNDKNTSDGDPERPKGVEWGSSEVGGDC